MNNLFVFNKYILLFNSPKFKRGRNPLTLSFFVYLVF